MFSYLKNVFDLNQKELKRIEKKVKHIHEWDFSSVSDEELQSQTAILNQKAKDIKSLDELVPHAFAVVKEASKRVLGKVHYDVQLIGGMVLHEGNVAEMKTGEGKTLVGTLPSYLNAIAGIKVHVVTVNEYLAKRDYEELLPLFQYLNIPTSFIHSDMTPDEKKKAYQASIIYGTNNEFGFDYLRDNMTKGLEDRVQGELGFAIVDEVDSILIDESRTPLIISGKSNDTAKLLYNTNILVRMFIKGKDFEVDETTQQCFLTEEGIAKTEKSFGIENLYAPDSTQIVHFLNQSLRAHSIMKKDKDYIVQNDEVHIIDTFTGRVSQGRRFSNSLHQAIEVKENVTMKDETVTKATITFQNYFRMYKKLSGMTGTAETEKEELHKVYGMDTISIPTNKPVDRKDYSDLIFSNKKKKEQAILKKVKELHDEGQPILIGTSSIEESETFSSALNSIGISHVVLNAKNHEKEADIIAQAGQKFAITVATNMAGRGTDIKLGEGVTELGGLFIIGTSKNENRRIDNQLRGRSGRQGDPGASQFYVSLEDDLMVRFGANRVQQTMDRINGIDEEGLSSGFLNKIFENAQKQLEGSNYDTRKRLLQYDDVLNRQRTIIYSERIALMTEEDLRPVILHLIDGVVESAMQEHGNSDSTSIVANSIELHDYFENLAKKSIDKVNSDIVNSKEEMIAYYKDILVSHLTNNFEGIPQEFERDIYKDVMLNNIDLLWERHLENLDEIRQGIHLQSYGQTDPLRAYEDRASEEFNDMLKQFEFSVVSTLCALKINIAPVEQLQN